jgi:signal peptidase I
VVADESLVPLLHPGDRVLVDPGAYRRRLPRPREFVVLSDPEGRVRWLIKRVESIQPSRQGGSGDSVQLVVRGTRTPLSRDSRTFGPVPLSAVLGEAYFRYHPPSRRGPLGPGSKETGEGVSPGG